MAELATVAIYSPKDGRSRWIINREDYDPDTHKLWDGDNAVVEQQKTPEVETEEQAKDQEVGFDEINLEDESNDFVTDQSGEITDIVIVDPDDKRARKIIPSTKYDPDHHVLWSERSRASLR